MSTGLMVRNDGPATLAQVDPQRWSVMKEMAAWVSRSAELPKCYQGKPETVMTAFLACIGMGLDPMVGILKGYVIRGKFDVEIQVKLGMVMAREARFDYKVDELTETSATVTGGLRDKTQQTVTYTMEDARKAGLLNKNQEGKWEHPGYQNNPKDQLLARAVGRLLQRTAPHAIYNMPVTFDEGEGAPDESTPKQPAAATPEPGQPTATSTPKLTVVKPGEVGATERPAAEPAPFGPRAVAKPVDATDYRQRFYQLMHVCGWVKGDPPAKASGMLGEWVKRNASTIGRVINEIHRQIGRAPVKGLSQVGESDFKDFVEYLEKKYADRIAAGGPGAPTEPTGASQSEAPTPPAASSTPAPPASSAEVIEFPEEPPAATEPPSELEVITADASGDRIISLALEIQKRRPERELVFTSEKGTPWFVDGPILERLAMTNAKGPVSQNIRTLSPDNRRALAVELMKLRSAV